MKPELHIEGQAVSPAVDLLMRGRARVAQGWRKHGFERDGEVCALGGIGGRDGIQHDGPPDFFQAQHFLYLALGRELKHAWPWEGMHIAKLNDAPETTQADILALYDRAIELALT